MTREEQVKHLNTLLRRELAATETYQQAIAKVGNDAKAADLHAIHADHRAQANEFRKHVHEHGGRPEQGSGPWGILARVVTATAKMLGTTTMLRALKEGEQQRMRGYRKALAELNWPIDCRALITDAMSQCRSHVQRLEHLMTAGK